MLVSLKIGEVPEWSKGADCKSVGYAFEGSNPSLPNRSDPCLQTITAGRDCFFYRCVGYEPGMTNTSAMTRPSVLKKNLSAAINERYY